MLLISELKFAKPGDWIVEEEGRIVENIKAHKERINSERIFFEEASKDLTKAMKIRRSINFFKNLFGKISYHFINQNKFANFEAFPEDKKVIYIGGILVEENENITTVKNFVRFLALKKLIKQIFFK